MVEQGICQQIINELGPVGLLVAGLYWIIGKQLAEIAKHIAKINDETGQIVEVLKEIRGKECGKG